MRTSLLLTSVLLLSIGCVGEIGPGIEPPRSPPLMPASSPQDFATARILIDDDPWFPKVEMRRGCDFWLEVGVQCLVVSDPAEADIHIRPNYDVCPPHPSGGVVLAWAGGGGDIQVYVRCLAKTGSQVNVDVLRTMVAHEVGHQLRVWEHIPDKCDGTEKVATDGTGIHICGHAIMNPYINADLQALTTLDKEAYNVADPKGTVIQGTVTTTRSALTAPHKCQLIMN